MRFKSITAPDKIPALEESLVEYWESAKVFERSVSGRKTQKKFIFFEGPPTANGKPGVHHIIARLCKDLVCRYRAMQGYQVVRKAGWDTHGLPVEIEVEKSLGIDHKDQIEEYGVAEFNRKCRESVFKYEQEWVKFTKRIGYWLDFDNAYITCKNEYIETVWWILSEFFNKDLLYKGHKIVPYCPRCETSLSSHEVSLGYNDVSDPSIFVKFKASDSDDRFLVWTTTPWTLVSNSGLAVGPDHEYVRVDHNGEKLILAKALLNVLDGDYTVLDTFKGNELVGKTYEPLFDYFKDAEGAFRVLPGDFVSLEDGTGIVHAAPAFGEDDYRLHQRDGIPLLQPVTSRGTFTDDITEWAGMWIKDADPKIIRSLKDSGKLYRSERYTHSYPFCWRCSTPLIYFARRSWYIKTTAFKDQMVEANKKLGWYPEEVGQHRFGNWLENNIDWALSRERYWGTPLNIWICDECEKRHAVGSIKELRELGGSSIPGDDELDLHRPQVDEYELTCTKCKGKMTRVADVVDAWFDSGSMPFAQYHYPFDTSGVFEDQFPADYICEGIDQSRGWFYSLLVISVFLKGESAYKNCVVTELILDKKGQKMSKSKGNVVDPWDLLNAEGADAVRWYLISSSPPWLPTRFDRKGVTEASQKLLGTLRNVYSFFTLYASVDDFEPGGDAGALSLLDRWILSRYHSTVANVTAQLDGYDMTRAARTLQTFVIDELSNWYIRRSRRRFWKDKMGPDKIGAYNTLYTVLSGTVRLLAPFVPFVAEEIYQALHGETGDGAEDSSVHLEDFPQSDTTLIDRELESLMETALMVSSLGRTVRNEAGIKIRQPLAEMLIHDNGDRSKKLVADEAVLAIVLDELHVKELRFIDDLTRVVTFKAKPAFPVLGKRFGKRVPEVAEAIRALSGDVLADFNRTGEAAADLSGEKITLGRDEMSVTVEGQEPYGAWIERGVTVALNLKIDGPLRLEGIAREIVNRLQNLRKKAGYDMSDRIALHYDGGKTADDVFESQGALIQREALAESAERGEQDWPDVTELTVDDETVRLWIRRI